MLNDSDNVKKVVGYLSETDIGNDAAPSSSFFSPHKDFDVSLYPNQVTKDEAYAWAQRAAKEEGIFLGVSSGASLAAVSKKLADIPAGSTVLTFCYDTGERYLSVEGLF